MDDEVWVSTKERVATTSRLRRWWLVRVRKYNVIGLELTPRATFYGSLQMMPRWILSAPDLAQRHF
jgi:hypothetical protein